MKSTGRPAPKLRVAFVVQRYGTEVNGGAEVHCRELVEHMAPFWDVEVLTSCSRDYVYRFENDYAPGPSTVNSIPVRRFAVEHRRSEPAVFTQLDKKVLARSSSPEEDEVWTAEVGPRCPGLRDHVANPGNGYDLIVFFTYLYWTTASVLPAVRERAMLVPTAHDEPPLYARPFDTLFGLPRALLCNTREEETLLRRRTVAELAPSYVVGTGVEIAAAVDPSTFRAHMGIRGEFALYVGRVQKEKGCEELFRDYLSLPAATRARLPLVVIGKSAMPIPDTPDIRYAGFVSDELKHSAMAGTTLLVMPSRYESLSLVMLESWLSGAPVLVNGKCDVLKNQCRRCHGGLWYDGPEEFREAFSYLTDPANAGVRRALAANGRRYVAQNHRWEGIIDSYLRIGDHVAGKP